MPPMPKTLSGPPIEAVVFDAVGTLIYPQPPVAAVYAAVGRQHGSRRTTAEVRRRFAAAFAAEEARDRGSLRTDEEREIRRWQEVVGWVLDDAADPAACFAELFAHFGRAGGWACYPEVGPTLARLRSLGLPVAIASNFDRRVRAVCRGLGELAAVGPIVISSEVGYRKPHPALFAAAAAALDRRPEVILWVGDDLANDYQGARGAGMPSLLLSRREPPADPSIASIRDLGQLLSGCLAN